MRPSTFATIEASHLPHARGCDVAWFQGAGDLRCGSDFGSSTLRIRTAACPNCDIHRSDFEWPLYVGSSGDFFDLIDFLEGR
jgi:hypothetical protein